ncbi:CYFA0S14e01838g1_1 [Cyberlindnera fabianii]|uniref:CYFA0S14e01838g1_1 n=1 Tax=Cyberlindnera fabianii TaxID=36022 RepID=A0A061BBJ0_CYBFA|nr:Superoxide dismutase [Fe] [Cyberlindnera fabianii]CDR44304.1 CYFA0S14e01838g1_1 [Cyberlindnera fabianii]
MSFISRRLIHTVPRLSTKLPGLYSEKGFQTAWTDYQTLLTTRLSQLTAGTADETRFPFHIAQIHAKDQTKQKVFNAASQAHNNHFFFQQLVSPENNTTRPSRQLEERIEARFGSLDGLKKELVAQSEKIIGQGWLFVVEDYTKQLDILALNNSGTPYHFAGNHALDLNGPISEGDYNELTAMQKDLAEGGQDYTLPLLAVSLWDQSYLVDYGVSGRKQYIEKVFDATNWDVVSSRVFKL